MGTGPWRLQEQTVLHPAKGSDLTGQAKLEKCWYFAS